jgi:hypothetical protein
MKSKLRSFVCLAALAAGIIAIPAAAAIPLGENSRVQIGGFISQGYIKSDGNNYPFQDNQGTFDFREMAFNASTTFGSHLRVGGQLFAQRLGNYGDDKVKLDWANADYNFRQEIGVRAGRIKYPKGLYGEALDLDVVRPFIFLPMSVYNPVLRDFSASFDGAMVYGTLGLGAKGGSLDYKVFYGDIKMDKDQGVADFFNDSDLYAGGVQKLGMDSVKGIALDWSTPVSGLKVHASYSELENLFGDGQFAAMPVLPVSIGLPSIGYTTFGAEYVRGDWTFAAEYQIQDGDTKITALPVLNQTGNYGMNNWYVSAARRFAGKWEVGGYYSFSENRYPSATATKDAKQIGDWALSLRYDLNEHVTFKAEYHYVDGNYNMFNTAKTPNPTLDDKTQLFALKTTLSF